jgi:hypothetical protein
MKIRQDKGDAKLIGVEYVISDDRFQKLPTNEKAYWHPTAMRFLPDC